MKRLNALKDIEWTRGDHFIFEDKDHSWLLDNLTSNRPGYHGCEINIPETVIFENGDMKRIVKTTDDGFFTQIRGFLSISSPMAPTEINNHLA